MYNFENDQIAFETDPQVLANQLDHTQHRVRASVNSTYKKLLNLQPILVTRE